MRIRRADPILKVPDGYADSAVARGRPHRGTCDVRARVPGLANSSSLPAPHTQTCCPLDIATRVWSTSRGTRPPSRPGALRRLSERAIVTTLLMPAPLDVDDEIGGVVRRALPIPYVGGSRIQPSSVQSA